MTVGGLPLVSVEIAGLGTATVGFERHHRGATWTPIRSINLSSGAAGTAGSANGLYQVPVAGIEQLRCNLTAITAGSATIKGLGIHTAAGYALTS